MFKLFLPLCVLFMVAASCTSRMNDKEVKYEVERIQKEVQEMGSDSSYFKLKRSEKLLRENGKFDSLEIVNDFLIGMYFRENGNLDSAAVNFQRVTDKIQDSAYGAHHREYFYRAWFTYYIKGKFGDSFSISKKFKSLIDTTKTSHSLQRYYYFQELTFFKIKDYQKSLFYNKLRAEVIRKRNKEDISLPGCLIQRSRVHYYGLNDRAATFAILNELLEKKSSIRKIDLSLVYSDLGVIYFYEGDFEKSLTYYLKALNTIKEHKDVPEYTGQLANNYSNIAEVLVELKEYNKAQKYIDSIKYIGLAAINEGTQRLTLRSQLKLGMLTNRDPEESLKLLDTLFQYRDKLYEDKFNNELVALKKAHEDQATLVAAKQKAELKAIRLRAVNIFFALLVVSASTITYLLYRYRNFRKKLEKWLIKNIGNNNSIQYEGLDTSKYITIPLPILNHILQSLEKFEAQNKFLSQQINLRGLAKSLNTNYTYLSKVINMKKGKNFTKYINDLRVEYAYNELATNADFKKYTIKAIAVECGFKSAESFSKCFHNKYGMYPSSYMKKLENHL